MSASTCVKFLSLCWCLLHEKVLSWNVPLTHKNTPTHSWSLPNFHSLLPVFILYPSWLIDSESPVYYLFSFQKLAMCSSAIKFLLAVSPVHALVSNKLTLRRLISKPIAAPMSCMVRRSSREQAAVCWRWPFFVGPIRGEISQQIAAAPSVSGALLCFDPMKLAWNNRAAPSTLPLSSICQFLMPLSSSLFQQFPCSLLLIIFMPACFISLPPF